MATYKLIGSRFLRKYTAKNLSPAYAAQLDAQTVVDEFCNVPWELVNPKTSQFAYHTEEVVDKESGRTGLDENVAIRDSLDAALFCAEHSAGMHRAYAQAMCLRFTLPDDAVGASLSSLKLKVSSDPYNSGGCRVSAFTNSTGEIPTNCNTVRAGSVHADAQVPRTSQTSGGTTYWYAAQGDVTLTPDSAITLQKYLFVFFGLEDYSITRGNWLEGSATLKNLVEITTSAAVTGWTDGETYDLSTAADPASVSVYNLVSRCGGAVYTIDAHIAVSSVGADVEGGDDVTPNAADIGTMYGIAETVYPLRHALAKFLNGELTTVNGIRSLAVDNFTAPTDTTNHNDFPAHTCFGFGKNSGNSGYRRILWANSCWLPFMLPERFNPSSLVARICLSHLANASNFSSYSGYRFNFWLKEGIVKNIGSDYKNPHLYMADMSEVAGWTLLGSAQPLIANRTNKFLDEEGTTVTRTRTMDHVELDIKGLLEGVRTGTLLLTAYYPLDSLAANAKELSYTNSNSLTLDTFTAAGYIGFGNISDLRFLA